MSTLQSSESSAVETQGELTPTNERAILRLFEQVYSGGELLDVEDIVAPDYRGYCSGTRATYHGRSGVKSHVARLRAAFYGFEFHIHDIQGISDGIAVRWTVTGRLERPVMGLQPECIIGRKGEEPGGPDVTVTGRTSLKMTNGKVRESLMYWDLGELLAQGGSRTNQSPTADELGRTQ